MLCWNICNFTLISSCHAVVNANCDPPLFSVRRVNSSWPGLACHRVISPLSPLRKSGVVCQTITNYPCTPVRYCTRSSNDFLWLNKWKDNYEYPSVHLWPQSPIRRNAPDYDEGEQGEDDHREEEKSKIHPIQPELMPHLFQLATLPPTWSCMVDV
jgi:hypothetical protein